MTNKFILIDNIGYKNFRWSDILFKNKALNKDPKLCDNTNKIRYQIDYHV